MENQTRIIQSKRKSKKCQRKLVQLNKQDTPEQTNSQAQQVAMSPKSIPIPREVCINTSLLGLDSDPNMKCLLDIVEYKDLEVDSSKFKKIQALFPPSLVVLKIKQVYNPFIRLSFQLKQHFHYADVKPLKLFHATKLKYVHNICKYNFDWRFNGAEKGHKYGMGINFTQQPIFALNFCEKEVNEKIVILTDVLVINTIIGKPHLEVPPSGYDTTVAERGNVFVKFSDAEFYPHYVIFFRRH